ncbi:MAG: hypothetical protein ACFFDW_15535 [Candidatus Thorarchaeota archaeon]
MPPYNSFSLIRSNLSKKLLFIILILIIGLIVFQFSIANVSADDEDEGDDDHEGISFDLGWAAVGLLVVSSVYVIFYQTFKLINRFSDEGRFAEVKNNYGNFFRTIRKPLLYIHYLSGFSALVVLIIHGIILTDGEPSAVAIGWASGAIYIFYILTGILLWLRVKPFWSNKTIRKILYFLHRSLIVFGIIIILHIIHLAINGE